MTTPLVLLHGFLGSPADWDDLRSRLEGRKCFALPLIGHPPHTYGHMRPTPFASVSQDIAEALEPRAPYDVLGYSMGGRVALHLLCSRPELFRRAVVVGASPGIDDAEERRRRALHDEKVAERLARGPAERFVAWWYDQQIFASLRAHPAFEGLRARREATCRSHGAGMADGLRILGVGQQEPLRKPLATCPVPALLMAGSLDAKYVASNRELAAANPQFQAVTVPGAGHAPHLEQPDEFLRIVRDWLDRP